MPEKQFYVYLHCKPNGDPFYVGKGCGMRAFRVTRTDNAHHAHVVAKYGQENILIYVFPCDSEAAAFDKEIDWIRVLRDFGYKLANHLDGGDNPPSRKGMKISSVGRTNMSAAAKLRIISKETREKMANSLRGHLHTAEQNARHAEFMRGTKHHLGFKHSTEARAKMSAAKIGKKQSPEHIAKRFAWRLTSA